MKKLTKLMSVILACAMLLAIAIPVASVSADDKLSVTVETVDSTAGTKNVGVKIFMPTGWSGLDMTLKFDPAKLTFKRFEQNMAVQHQARDGEPNTYVLNKNEATTKGEVIVAFASAVVYNGVEGYCNVDVDDDTVYDYFGIAVFDVAEGVSGLQSVSAVINKLIDVVEGENVNLEYEVTNGGINIPVAPHDHDYGDWQVRTPATCSAAGVKYRVCSVCQDEETDVIEIDPDAHDWSDWTPIEGRDGWEQRVCRHNAEHVEEREIPFDGVDIVVETVDSAPGAKNVEVKIFIPTGWSGLDMTINFDPAKLTFKRFEQNPAVQHQARDGEPNTYVLNKNNATSGEVIVAFASAVVYNGVEGYCNVDVDDDTVYDYFGIAVFDVADDAEGLQEITATVNKLIDVVDSQNVNVNYRLTNGGINAQTCQHNWVETSRIPATCSAKGSITYTCSLCQKTRTEDIDIDPDAHNWGEWDVTTPATCTTKAVETRVCAYNSEHTETREVGEVNPEAHSWGEWTETTPATCSTKAVETRVCANDPTHTETREVGEVNPEAHVWGDWTVTTPATCTAKGEKTRTCTLCQETENEDIDIDPNAHAYGDWTVTTPATCTEKGVETRVCANDPTHTETRDVNPTGHVWGEWITTKEPTDTEDGEAVRTCTLNEEHKETKVLPKLGVVPVVSGIEDGGKYDVADKPSATWEPADSTATLNGEPYTPGTVITEAGEYELVVTNGSKTTTVKFTVTKAENDQPNTSDLPIAGVAVVALIASAAVVVIARKKRLA